MCMGVGYIVNIVKKVVYIFSPFGSASNNISFGSARDVVTWPPCVLCLSSVKYKSTIYIYTHVYIIQSLEYRQHVLSARKCTAVRTIDFTRGAVGFCASSVDR